MLSHTESSLATNMYRNNISIDRDHGYHHQQSSGEINQIETSKAQQYLKKTGKFLFSHIGLVVLVAIYAAAGGFLFVLLEEHQDKLNCQEAQGQFDVELTTLKQKIVSYIQYNTTIMATATTLTYSTQLDNSTVALATLGEMLYDYRGFIIDTGSTYRFYGDDCSVAKWTFVNGLLFAITIFTTIGYGNITPVTWEGQICCICYATIGIPIFLLCIANISGALGDMFRFIYGRICCAPYNMIKRRQDFARKAKLHAESGMNENRTNKSPWTTNDRNQSMKKGSNTLEQEPNPDENDPSDMSRTTVPLTITMLIIAGYIGAGALLFHAFESWTTTQAGYFCFITLATIGFGDFVPGQSADGRSKTLNLIVGAIYVLFGMAILAMCFDLMQEEIVAKFRWLGRKMGLVDKEEDLNVKQKSTVSNSNDNKTTHTRPSTANSDTSSNRTMNKDGRMMDDDDDDYDNEDNWAPQSASSGTRKHSPRHNLARVHPMSANSNEGSLHQRAGPTKK